MAFKKYQPDDLQKACKKWWDKTIDENGKFLRTPATLQIARELEIDKVTMYSYANNEDPAYSQPVKKCLNLVEEWHESGLSGTTCTGHIFGLKNSGWSDTQKVEHSGSLPVAGILQIQVVEPKNAD